VIINDISQEIKNKIQKETFVDIISHDLKNPMRANIRILELIMQNKFGIIEDNKLKSVLEELLNSCRFMSYMADNLLIKYKNEFDLYELQKQQYSIVKLIKERCNKLMNILERKKQSIELVIKGSTPDINIDVNEMAKVINNLIINASEQSIENSKIIIEVENNKERIEVSFTDYGYPQKQEMLNGIFEEYITCSNKFRKIGFGLELFNCRKIIEAHNGYICAKNETDTGTSITFSLPCI
ncbi:MAG: HAMP domain-containing histidine kinase, partial [Candidatus Gastranaerophilales bacterium]|nr:HAMP domain-containing histidine kinase [Candidatus Gastranaerophilales bacterium]